MAKGGRKPLITKERVMKAIPGTHGLVMNISKKLGVSYTSLYCFLQKLDDRTWYDTMLKEEHEKLCDVAEDSLFDDIIKGDTRSRNFYLKTKGRDRGYVTKTENDVTGVESGSAVINVIMMKDADVKKAKKK